MSDDLISRQEAIEAVDGLSAFASMYVKEEDECGFRSGVAVSVRQLGLLPSAEPEQKWISVSEIWKLENDEAYSDRVLVQLRKDNVVAIAYYDENALSSDGAYYDTPGWVLDSGKRIVEKDVVRWMPLPEPYQGEGKQDE